MLWGVPGVSETEAGLAVTPAGNALNATAVLPLKPLSAVAVNWTACPTPPMIKLND
jgi:hypothetical protein